MVDILAAAREEERRLLAELNANPTFQRLELIRAVIQSYQAAAIPRTIADVPPGFRKREPRQNSVAAQVVRVAEAFLSNLGRRATSTEIALEVSRHGIELKGMKAPAMVASYLSSSDRFDNVKGQGYGLANRDQSAPPTESQGNNPDPGSKTDAASSTVVKIAA